MNAILTRLSGLPGPARAVLLVACGGGLLGAAYIMFPQYIWIIVIGMIVMSIAVGVFAILSKWRSKKKAAPMEKDLVGNASARPGGMSNPDHIAKLDDLRKQFQTGLEKFRAAGKNLYSLPWYALVGEPGSGKTEAIRHCQVGFPPGLQDQYQGAGGTLNMNWWFTNHAVIIDTAGRLMFEDVQPGQTSEWTEFLKMLRTHRPNCPINGMLLVIPADSLIKDDANEIERKASKIAQQLDNIQRQLGVRFPVFVVVTKCDLITGFREFFRHIDDPEGQGQVLGWSNPNELDEVFEPHQVDRYLDEVRKRMLRRRMALMLEEGHCETPEEKRLNKVDSLFAFPEALMKIAPRLKRYLEMVFVAGEWSSKPLFLRGIYFTSAMEEGGALDQDLAEALGVEVSSLTQDGGVFRRERSVFLRDMFLRKVFQERGLVTRASNTKQMQRRRRTITLSALVAAVVIMITVTWFSATSLDNSIGKHAEFWKTAERELVVDPDVSPMEILQKPGSGEEYAYAGVNELDDLNMPVGEFPEKAKADAEQSISVPLIFKPVSWFSDLLATDLDTARKDALRAMFASIYLEPVVDAAQAKLEATPAPQWDQVRAEALEQLLLMEADSARPDSLVHGSGVRHFELEPLFRTALTQEGDRKHLDSYLQDADNLANVFDWLYKSRSEARQWPPAALVGRKNQKVIETGVERFVARWGSADASSTNKLGKLIALRDAIEGFKKAEDDLLKFRDQYPNPTGEGEPTTLVQHEQVVSLWDRRLAEVRQERKRLDDAVAALGSDLDGKSIATLTAEAGDEINQTLLPRFRKLIAAAASYEQPIGGEGTAPQPDEEESADDAEGGDADGDGDDEPNGDEDDTSSPAVESTETTVFLDKMAERLKDAADALEAATKSEISVLRTVLSDYESDYLAKEGGSTQRGYAARAEIYARADQELKAEETLTEVVELTGASQAMQQSLDEARTDFEAIARRAPNSEPYENAEHVGKFILRVAERFRNYTLYTKALELFPKKAEEAADLVSKGVAGAEVVKMPVIAGTSFQDPDKAFDLKYQPKAASALLKSLNEIGSAINSDSVTLKVLDREGLQPQFDEANLPLKLYVEDYVTYWTQSVRKMGNVRTFDDWTSFREGIAKIEAFNVTPDLKELNRTVADALNRVPRDLRSRKAEEMIAGELAAQEREAPNLDNDLFSNVCDSTVRAWEELGKTAEAAILSVRGMTGSTVRNKLLRPYPKTAGVRYWRSLCVEGMTRLAEAGHDRALVAVDQIIREGKGFPLCLVNNPAAQPPLDKKTIEQIQQQVTKVAARSRAASAAGGDAQSVSIGEGGRLGSGYEELDELLRRMNGGAALGDEKTRTWFTKVAAICNALADPNNQQTMQVRAPQLSAQDKAPQIRVGPAPGERLTNVYLKYAVHQDGLLMGQQLNTAEPTLDVHDIPKLRLPTPKPTELLLFKFTDDPQPSQKLSFASPWSVLEVLQYGTPQENGTTWLVPVVVQRHDQPGARVYWWVELRFARPLPPFKDWPREADWPVR